jgi:PadR family transcriptional regulator, regulatory protein AphA
MSLTYALLGMISRQPCHGYELRQMFSSALGGEWSISYGQLYPALGRLESAGHIQKRSEPGDRASDRHIYSITPAGTALLRDWLVTPCGCQVRVKDDLSLRLVLFDKIDQAGRVAYISQYRTETAERRASLAASFPDVSDPWMAAIVRRGLAACDAELAWCDGMLDQARRSV